jgi:signal recognition particle subunit SEC65
VVRKGEGRIVLWPVYFDAKRSRKAGRRVSSDLAVAKPDAKWVETAAKKAGFSTELEEKARHPSIPYETMGRVLVKAQGGKEAVLKAVAARLQRE